MPCEKDLENMNQAGEPSGGGTSQRWKPLLLIGLVGFAFILAHYYGIGSKLGALRGWIASFGPWAPIMYVVLYILATVAALPGSALTIIGGALFGSMLGVVLVSIGSTLGAASAFLIARYFARESVAQWLQGNPKFKKLDALSESRGAIIVAITRLVPIFPFNLLNYGFGLTRIPFRTYFFWSWLCMIPGITLFVVGTDVLVRGTTEGRVPWELILVFLFTALMIFLLVHSARRKLERPPGPPDTTGGSIK